jgi:hypothetical protein
MNQFKKDDRVAEITRFNPNEDCVPYGIVTAVSSNGDCLVKWDSGWRSEKYVSAAQLMSETESIAFHSKLEAEFKILKDQIVDKMKEAANAIKEAAALADTFECNLNKIDDVTDPLYRAMDSAGWRTSSFDC